MQQQLVCLFQNEAQNHTYLYSPVQYDDPCSLWEKVILKSLFFHFSGGIFLPVNHDLRLRLTRCCICCEFCFQKKLSFLAHNPMKKHYKQVKDNKYYILTYFCFSMPCCPPSGQTLKRCFQVLTFPD